MKTNLGSVPAGRAERIVRIQKEAIREQKEKAQRMLLLDSVQSLSFWLL